MPHQLLSNWQNDAFWHSEDSQFAGTFTRRAHHLESAISSVHVYFTWWYARSDKISSWPTPNFYSELVFIIVCLRLLDSLSLTVVNQQQSNNGQLSIKHFRCVGDINPITSDAPEAFHKELVPVKCIFFCISTILQTKQSAMVSCSLMKLN